MKIIQLTILMAWLLLLLETKVEAKPLQLPAIQVVPIQDSGTGRDYELYIKLPEGYDAKSDKKHPVIYVVDALWNLEVISGSIEYFVKDAILVGISWELGTPPQQSRMRDYTPIKYTGKDYKHPTGEADKHIAFMRNDIFKHVESEYKTDTSNRSFYGYSLGGAFGSYILLTQPNLFHNYILGSPTTLTNGKFIHEHKPISLAIPSSIDANVFVSIGTDEQAKDIEQAISLTRFLKTKVPNKSQVQFKLIESADHGKAFPKSAIQSLDWLAEHSK